MRMELLFELEKNELPKDNKSIWVSFLKNVISNCNNGKFYERYFSGTKSKDYTFSILMPGVSFVQEKAILNNNQVKMIFSADDRNKTGFIFFSAFIKAKNKRFPLPDGNAMVLKHIRPCREQSITSSKVLFRTAIGGGLVVREHNRETNRDQYHTFQDAGFDEHLKRILKAQAQEAGFSERMVETVKVTPIQCKKVVVKHYGVWIDVTVGSLEIEGDSDLLRYYYQAGLGSKHSMGYGMLDIISQENSREEGACAKGIGI